MADNKTKSQRSYNMSCIHSANTKPELIVRKYLYSNGIRYRLRPTNLIGRPDIVIKKRNCIIFVNGCFWHRHKNCKKATLPKSNIDFWSEKFRKNTQRDKETYMQLKNAGWNVITIWECQLSSEKRQETLDLLLKKMQ